MLSRARVGVLGFVHESHSFLEEETALEAFRILGGEAMFNPSSAGPQTSGFIEGLREQGLEPVPLIDYRAPPGGPVTSAAFEHAMQAIESRIARAGALDAILLGLHGAMLSRECDDLDGLLLRKLRERFPNMPLFGTLDLHANMSCEMARHADCLLACRENPHLDVRDTAHRAARLLSEQLRGHVWLHTVYAHSGLVWPPIGTATNTEPMCRLEALARQIEADDPEVCAVNIFAGYAYADAYSTGASFTIATSGRAQAAQRHLQRLIGCARQFNPSAFPKFRSVEDVVSALPAQHGAEGPILIVEPADNIGAGAPGDCTDVLRAFIDNRLEGSAVIINDPVSAGRCHAAGQGQQLDLELGGRGYSGDVGPVRISAKIISLSDGRFQLEDPDSHMAASRGTVIEMGPSAVVKHDSGVTVLITSRRTPPNDLGQWRSQSLEPAAFRLICVKAAVAHRHAYRSVSRVEHIVETRGPCPSRLDRLPYRRRHASVPRAE